MLHDTSALNDLLSRSWLRMVINETYYNHSPFYIEFFIMGFCLLALFVFAFMCGMFLGYLLPISKGWKRVMFFIPSIFLGMVLYIVPAYSTAYKKEIYNYLTTEEFPLTVLSDNFQDIVNVTHNRVNLFDTHDRGEIRYLSRVKLVGVKGDKFFLKIVQNFSDDEIIQFPAIVVLNEVYSYLEIKHFRDAMEHRQEPTETSHPLLEDKGAGNKEYRARMDFESLK